MSLSIDFKLYFLDPHELARSKAEMRGQEILIYAQDIAIELSSFENILDLRVYIVLQKSEVDSIGCLFFCVP